LESVEGRIELIKYVGLSASALNNSKRKTEPYLYYFVGKITLRNKIKRKELFARSYFKNLYKKNNKDTEVMPLMLLWWLDTHAVVPCGRTLAATVAGSYRCCFCGCWALYQVTNIATAVTSGS
jgi:hypothetical protein